MSNPHSGHGWVFRNRDGHKANCGGPDTCPSCQADLERLAACTNATDTVAEAEIQAMCHRAQEAT